MISHRFYPQLMVTCLLILFAILWSCGKGPTKPGEQNDPPDTFITKKSLAKVPLETDSTGAFVNLTQFIYSIEFTGVDLDGKVDSFQVRINNGPWSAYSTKTNRSDTLDFDSETAVNTVSVRSKDDQGAEDPTPATAEFTLAEIEANAKPTTAFASGPGNGTTTGLGVRFIVSGSDEDGEISSFIYSLDGGAEITLTADADGKAVIEFSAALGNLLSIGNHAVSARSVDNLGAEDATPETRSFFATTGFKPIVTQADGPPPGGGWFTGADIPFAWNTAVAHYSGVIDTYQFSIDDPVNFTDTTATSIALPEQDAGPHTFRVRAVDIEGNISDPLEVSFNVALFAPTQGILFIDNMSFNPNTSVYASEPDVDQQVLDGFFQNFSQVSVWDVDRLSGGNRFPGAINTTSLPGPDDLAQYSSVVAMTDGGYALDNISALLAAYFQAGGNLMITGYQSTDFGQVLKDVLGTPTVFNGFGTSLMSLEGFQAAEGNNSDAFAFLTGADVVPIVPGTTNRSWEITTNVAPTSLRVLFANVFEGGSFGGFRIATETQGAKGNWGLWVGVSMGYLDQKSTGIVKFGDFVCGDRFGEVKN